MVLLGKQNNRSNRSSKEVNKRSSKPKQQLLISTSLVSHAFAFVATTKNLPVTKFSKKKKKKAKKPTFIPARLTAVAIIIIIIAHPPDEFMHRPAFYVGSASTIISDSINPDAITRMCFNHH